MVSQPFLTEMVGLMVKTETSYGTEATPSAATDALYVNDFSYKPTNATIQRKYKHNALNQISDLPGSTLVDISFSFDYVTAGVAGSTVAPISAIEQACGMFQSASASTVTYLLQHTASTNFPSVGKSMTAHVYYRDQIYKITGIYGDLVETHNSDGVVNAQFTGKGLYTAATTGTAFTASMATGNYVKVASSSMRVHDGYDPEFSTFEMSYGAQLTQVPFSGNANGISKLLIVGREPSVKFKCLMDTVAGHDFIGKYISKATGSLTYNTGTGTGNRVAYSFPTTQYRQVDITEQDGVYFYDVTANVVGDWTKSIS